MQLETKYQGRVDIEENRVVRFDNGLPGFLDEKKYVVLPFSEGTPFFILQSVETPSLAFVIADPFLFYKDYDFTISDSVVEQLEIEREEDVSAYVMLTVQDPFEKTTANLQAPVLINHKKQQGKQIVLSDPQYTTKHLLAMGQASAGQEG